MAGSPPYIGDRDGEARGSELSGQQSGPNPGKNTVQQHHQIDLNQLPQQTNEIEKNDPPPFQSRFRPYQGSLPIPSSRSAFQRYQYPSQGTVPHHLMPPPSYMVGGSSQGTSSSSELQICTNSDMTSHQMPPSSSLIGCLSSQLQFQKQQEYSGPVNQLPDPTLFVPSRQMPPSSSSVEVQVNVPPILGYQPVVSPNPSRHQRFLSGADQVGGSSQGAVYHHPDTNSYMTSQQMPPSSFFVLEDGATWKEKREKRARALFEQNMKGWDYLKKESSHSRK